MIVPYPKDKVLGALYGALLGDAVGVPYEFKKRNSIPEFEHIDMVPPEGFDRSWKDIPAGTYSDDGGQLLCTLENLINEQYSANDLFITLQKWFKEGYMSVDARTFDAGFQTAAALSGTFDKVSTRLNDPKKCGNGSLMRTLPISFLDKDSTDLIRIADELSSATHPSLTCRAACAFYNVMVSCILGGMDLDGSILTARWRVKNFYGLEAENVYARHMPHTGSGFVTDSLWTAIHCVETTTSTENAIKMAISFGLDTDTTACIAGGLAGAKYGFEKLPMHWLNQMRGMDKVKQLTNQLQFKVIL